MKLQNTEIPRYGRKADSALIMSFSKTSEHQACVLCASKNIRLKSGYEEHLLAECRECGMVFMKRKASDELLADYYGSYSYATDPWISPITIQRYHELLDSFEAYRKTNRLLDVGCGAGHFLAVAKSRGWEVFGTEFSPAALRLCQSKGIQMFEGSLPELLRKGEELNLLREEFDVLTSIEVIEHLGEPHEDLSAMHKLLRSGGLMYLTTPNFNAVGRMRYRSAYQVIGYPEHLCYYTPKTLHTALSKHGLRKNSLRTTGISMTRIAKSKKGADAIKIGSKDAPDEHWRRKTESQAFWLFVKRVANWLLTTSGTGATIKARYLKP